MPKTGKRAGVGSWKAYKYPGNLKQAAHGLLDEVLAANSGDVRDLIEAVEQATERIEAALSAQLETVDAVIADLEPA